jgi:hypothetical protein
MSRFETCAASESVGPPADASSIVKLPASALLPVNTCAF